MKKSFHDRFEMEESVAMEGEREKGEKDLLIKAPLNPNHAPFPPSMPSVPLRPKRVFIRKGFQRDAREIGDYSHRIRRERQRLGVGKIMKAILTSAAADHQP